MSATFRMVQYFSLIILTLIGSVAAFGQAERDTGIQNYRAGKYQEAVNVLEKLYQEESADRPTLLYLAASYTKLGRTSDANAIFSRLDEAKPTKFGLGYDKNYKILNQPKVACSFSRGKKAFARAAVELGSDGKIGFVMVFDESGKTFGENAAKAARAIKFKPAIFNAAPVASIAIIEYACFPL